MKIALHGILILAVLFLLPGSGWTEIDPKTPEKLVGMIDFLPGDDEIPGWRRSEMFLQASNEEELYKIINGGASLYIQHGFLSYVGQTYKGPKGTELELNVYDQETNQNALDLYNNPFTKPNQIRDVTDLGEKARIDVTPLFCHAVDFIQKRFYIRVIIQDKTEDGLNAAISFARLISKKIK